MFLYRRILWWYLATPVLLFLLSWYDSALGIPLFLCLLFAVDYASQYSDIKDDHRSQYRFSLFLKILTITLAVLVAWGSLATNYWDWNKHRPLFYDLARCHWPISYDMDGTSYLLSYYLMYYLPPTMMTKAFGLKWLPEIAQVWTLMGYGLVLWGYFGRSRTMIEWLFLFLLLMTFSGWDILGAHWKYGKWPPYAVDFMNWNSTETSGSIYLFYYIPQHVIPAWLGGILLFRPELKAQDRVRFGSLLLALVAYWSPMVAIGLSAFILADLLSMDTVKTLIENKRMHFLSLCLVMPYYLYLSRSLSGIENSWTPISMGIWFKPYYLYFLFFSLTVIFAITLLLAGRQLNGRYLLVSLFILLLAPLYHFGAYNDLTMRGPMAEYYFLLASAGDGALNLLRRLRHAEIPLKPAMARLIVAVLCLMVSSVGPVYMTIPVIGAILHLDFFAPMSEGVQKIWGEDRLRNQLIVPITPVKTVLLRDTEMCEP